MKLSYIYAIGSDNGNIKIGFSNNPHQRLRSLQTGHNEPLQIHYIHEVSEENVKVFEKIIHKQLAHKRVHGEWFDITPSDVEQHIRFAFITYDDEPGLARRFKSGSVLLR